MIYEIRTYGLVPGSLAEVEKRFGEAYEYRKKFSELAAFWHTEFGPLNEIIHVWPYQDMADRARVRAETAKEPNWPPKINEFVRTMQSELLVPLPFAPPLKPGKYGPIYEIRIYNLKMGSAPDMIKAWEPKLAGRMKFSPLALAGTVDMGEANRFYHIWPYNTFEQRETVRMEARKQGVWPPATGPFLLTQQNKIAYPSAFSPVQ